MDEAAQFLRWWKTHRESNTALYPNPKDLTKTLHAKDYEAFLAELSVRWPKARPGVFKLLKEPRSELAALVRGAAKDAVKWWKSTAMMSFVEDSIEMTRKIRLDRSAMEFVMRNPADRRGAFGTYDPAFFDCFDADGGEKLLSQGTELRIGLNSWLEECLAWFDGVAKSPLAIPPVILTQRPSPPWGHSSGPAMELSTRNLISGIPTYGAFMTPTGSKSHDDAYWNDPWAVGSRPIYACVLGYVSHCLFEQRPTSLVQAAKAASVNPWSVATAFDNFLGVQAWHEDSIAHDWFVQVETAFSAWIKTGMGSLLELKQADGAPPNTGTFFRKPSAEHLWHDAFPFGKPSQTCDSSRATICGFMLDSILDFCLEVSDEGELSTPKAVGAQRQGGREGQVMGLVKDHPTWTKARVAEHLGIGRHSLSRGKLKAAWDSATELNRQKLRKGWRSNGSIESVADEEE